MREAAMRAKFSVMLLVLILVMMCAGQQKGRDDALPMPLPRLSDAWEIAVPKTPQPRSDPAQMKTQAEELAKLASGIPPDVEQIQHGLLAKDLKARLNRIQKLSKQLGQEVERLR
jgi:hypothetical protein